MSASNSEVVRYWQEGRARVGTNIRTDGETLFMFDSPIGRTLRNGTKSLLKVNEDYLLDTFGTTRHASAVESVIQEAVSNVNRVETPGQFMKAFA